MPHTPVKDAGWRIDPPVSVPVAAGARRAATAAADPPELPPGTARSSQGFFTGPKCEFSFDRDEGVETRIEALDAIEVCARELDRRDLLGSKPLRQAREGVAVHGGAAPGPTRSPAEPGRDRPRPAAQRTGSARARRSR